ncbi:MAG: YceI family protein [Anaerolineales bacterium]
MRKVDTFLLLGTAWIMAACSGQAATTSIQPSEHPSTIIANPTDLPATEAQGGSRHYQIIPSESEARFIIDEVLMGQDNTVTGATSQIAGGFSANLMAPEQATFEPIVIDAASFATDESRRDQAIQRFILESGSAANSTVTFTPTSVEGLPSQVAVGQEVEVSIAGDLEIHGVSQSAAFDGTIIAVSPERITGSFSTVVHRADFGLTIPSVRLVASVEEQLQLELDFAAEAS